MHNYYLYANNLFLSIFLGFLLIALFEKESHAKNNWIIGLALSLIVLFSLYLEYNGRHYQGQKNNDQSLLPVANFLKQNTLPEDILLIYGFDWEPTLPYYSERKALMDRSGLSLNSPKFKSVIEKLGGSKIKAMVFAVNPNQFRHFVEERIKFFHLNPRLYLIPPGIPVFLSQKVR